MKDTLYDPLELSKKMQDIVVKGSERKYYRIPRGGMWYGGIATGDCCGCNLRCIFCWSNAPRDHPDSIGKFYSPEDIFFKITSCAKKHNYRLLRVSGNEPTLSKEHLLKLLELVERTEYLFILETNGILIDNKFARSLTGFKSLEVRVALKGTTPEEFSLLTGAVPDGFELQIEALKNLANNGVKAFPAVMLSFSSKENFSKLKTRLRKISPAFEKSIDDEYVILYPHVKERLEKADIKPSIAYSSGR